MKQGFTLFLKGVILLIAIGAFSGMIYFPQTEGRASNLDLISIYKDPFIIYIYIGSIPFFIGLFQTFKLLNFIDANKTLSKGAINTLRNIKFASFSLIGFIALALFYIRFFVRDEDPAGPTMLGIIAVFAISVIGASANVFQKLLQNAGEKKSRRKL